MAGMKAKIGYGKKENIKKNIEAGKFNAGDIIFTSDKQTIAFVRPDNTPMYIMSGENTSFKSLTEARTYAQSNQAAYGGQVISVMENGTYNLYILQPLGSSFTLNRVDEKNIIVGTRPTENPKLDTIYIEDFKGYIWNGSDWIKIFEDASGKADLESPNFTGTPTINGEKIATEKWVKETINTSTADLIAVKIGDLGEYNNVVEYVDAKVTANASATDEKVANAISECKQYVDNSLTIVEF